ncbi:MAG: ABC transporter permease, partial [Actinomycetota bacterium]|nr:ABC transporter permease [Actinomycetota bacterium]
MVRASPPAQLVALVGNDVRHRFRDRPTLVAAALAPIVLALIASFSLSRLTRSFEGTYAIVDLDGGVVGEQLAAGIEGDARLADAIDLERIDTEAEAREAVDDGRIAAALVIPAGFSGTILQGQPAAITVVESPRHAPAAVVAGAIAEGAMASIRSDQLAVSTALNVEGGDLGGLGVGDLAVRVAEVAAPIAVVDVDLLDAGGAG